jgi:hypothetical protein
MITTNCQGLGIGERLLKFGGEFVDSHVWSSCIL